MPAPDPATTVARLGARRAPRSVALALAAGMTSACAGDEPPAAPGPPERRVVVVPAPLDRSARPATVPSCPATCPAARVGEELAGCHVADPSRAPAGTAASTDPEWVVCYFEPR